MPWPTSKNIIFKPKLIGLIIGGAVLTEAVSFASHFLPLLQPIGFITLVVAALLLAFYKLEYGMLLILTELAIGSHGHLFNLTIGSPAVSLRMGLFMAIILAWLFSRLRARNFDIPPAQTMWYYGLLALFIVGGVGQGIAHNQLTAVFFDFNAWLFFGLIVVVLDLKLTKPFVAQLLNIVAAATGWLAIKTSVVLLTFAYGLTTIGDPFYTWLRDSRLGEITYVEGTVFRIFFQSHLFVLVGLLIILTLAVTSWSRWTKTDKIVATIYLYLTSLAIIISQSRSFWVGLLAGLTLLIGLLIWRYRWRWKKVILLILLIILVTGSQLILIQTATGNFSGNLLAQRFKNLPSEPAGLSRLNQLGPLSFTIFQRLLFGYGFGKTVTYISDDPRIRAVQPDGVYTTYAFEWGYLDIMLKIGLLGLLAYLALLGYLTVRLIKQKNQLSAGVMAALTALLVTNVFSPYLNHPLGIGFVLFATWLAIQPSTALENV